jgi:plasmid maintenance system antidote protein VapI
LKTPLETVPAQLNKVIELQKSAFEKSVEFWKKVAATYSLETQQKAAAKAIELTRANYEAMVSAATANVKATQEYFG